MGTARYWKFLLSLFSGKWCILGLLLWVLLVLYPNPANAVVSVKRVLGPSTDPAAVLEISEKMPDDPAEIENKLLEDLPYAYDWETYGMPWYCPSVSEALEKGKGDCKARALVLSSILENKAIPHSIYCSPVHMWVEYEGKQRSAMEKEGVMIYDRAPDTGLASSSLPAIGVGEMFDTFWDGFWRSMPGLRKVLLLGGTIFLLSLRFAFCLLRRISGTFPQSKGP